VNVQYVFFIYLLILRSFLWHIICRFCKIENWNVVKSSHHAFIWHWMLLTFTWDCLTMLVTCTVLYINHSVPVFFHDIITWWVACGTQIWKMGFRFLMATNHQLDTKAHTFCAAVACVASVSFGGNWRAKMLFSIRKFRFGRAKPKSRVQKAGIRGRGRGGKETLANKPQVFENPRSWTNGLSDWCDTWQALH